MRQIVTGRVVRSLGLLLSCAALAPAGAAAAQEVIRQGRSGRLPLPVAEARIRDVGRRGGGRAVVAGRRSGNARSVRHAGRVGGPLERLVPRRLPRRFRRGPRRPVATGSRSAARRRRSHRSSRSRPARRCTRRCCRTRARSTRTSATAPNTSPPRCGRHRRHLNDEHAMTYATPKTNGNGVFKGDLRPLGETIDAAGGWWDAGDYLKFVETTSYTVSLMEAGGARLPHPARSGRAGRHDRRGPVRRRMAAADVGRTDRDALLPGRDRRGQREDRRRPRHLAAPPGRRRIRRREPRRPLHPQPPGVPRGAARRSDQPEPRGSRRGGVRALLPTVPGERRSTRRPLPERRRARLRTRGHEAERPAADRDPVGLLPRARMARRPRARRHRACRRARGRRRLRPSGGSRAHAAVLLPRRSGALGPGIREEGPRQLGNAEPLRRQRPR